MAFCHVLYVTYTLIIEVFKSIYMHLPASSHHFVRLWLLPEWDRHRTSCYRSSIYRLHAFSSIHLVALVPGVCTVYVYCTCLRVHACVFQCLFFIESLPQMCFEGKWLPKWLRADKNESRSLLAVEITFGGRYPGIPTWRFLHCPQCLLELGEYLFWTSRVCTALHPIFIRELYFYLQM